MEQDLLALSAVVAFEFVDLRRQESEAMLGALFFFVGTETRQARFSIRRLATDATVTVIIRGKDDVILFSWRSEVVEHAVQADPTDCVQSLEDREVVSAFLVAVIYRAVMRWLGTNWTQIFPRGVTVTTDSAALVPDGRRGSFSPKDAYEVRGASRVAAVRRFLEYFEVIQGSPLGV